MNYIFDFDGTLTDPFPHANAMGKMMVEILVGKGIPEDRVRGDISEIRNRILTNPNNYPWIINDIPGCYGDEDPFVVNNVTAQELLKTDHIYREVFGSPGELSAISYRIATKDMPSHLRQDTIKALKRLLDNGMGVYVVTNGGTTKVKRMIGEIDVGIPVYGDARKFKVDMDWEEIPQKIEIAGLPVYLRRKEYYTILKKIEGHKIVVGDVFSMDLSLPYTIGVPIVLLRTEYTPLWAEEFVRENGTVIESLLELFES